MSGQSAFLRTSKSTLLAGAIAALIASSASADDTEVFAAQIKAEQKPNLLFVLDYSGSMLHPIEVASRGEIQVDSDKKIDILRSAVRQLLIDNAGDINAGIGSLYGRSPSGVKWPISDLEADANTIDPNILVGTKTVTEVMSDLLDPRPSGGTSTVDALAEAMNYFRGGPVFNRGEDPLQTEHHVPATWDPVAQAYSGGDQYAAHPASYIPQDAYQATGATGGFGECVDFTLGGTQASEGENTCAGLVTYDCTTELNTTLSKNGTPTTTEYFECKYERDDRWLGASYKSPITRECQINAVVLISDGEPTKRNHNSEIDRLLGSSHQDCEDMGGIFTDGKFRYPAECGPELVNQMANNPQIPSIFDSTVRTYTVGFDVEGPGRTYLERLATEGNGSFFDANSPETLITSLNSIIGDLTSTSQSFAPLSIDVDRANFSHQNRAFFSMFKPKLNASWDGNLKGYFIDNTGLVDINNNPATVLNGNNIRVMTDDAQSFWSAVSDGDDVAKGGASELLTTGNRSLLTYTGPSDIPPAGVNVSNPIHRLNINNEQITDATLGIPEGRDTLLNWIQTAPMGDPLHSKPVQVRYDNNASDQHLIYIMTNQGFIHAIDASYPVAPDGSIAGGNEVFAFMPPELLTNIADHYANLEVEARTYGLDGSLVRWHVDNNKDGIVNDADTVTLIFGMRRGGNHYYALDVTDPGAPRYKWRIDGGSPEFPLLGETWSRPSLVTVIEDGAEKQVLAFGGGYDAAMLDGSTASIPGTLGNAIYMVDENGDKVMEVDGSLVTGMDYAIASDLTIIDSNGDDIVDRIYVGDLGGNIWRVDFDDIANGATTEKLADLNDGGHRAFFYPPSVSLNSSVDGNFLSIAIGSGNRTNPLRIDSNDRMYMIRDQAVSSELPSDYSLVRPQDLYNATANELGSSNALIATQARQALSQAKGWYINLDDNEKSLSPLVTFGGNILATTFDVDEVKLANPCLAAGLNYFYTVDVETAEPVLLLGNSNENTDFTAEDRRKIVNGDGILSQPTLVFPKNGDITVLVDNEIVSSISTDLTRIFWHAK